MFGNLGLHVIQFPSGRFGYVGSIPTELATKVPADTAAVLGCRSWLEEVNGKKVNMMWKFPVFDTEAAAIEFAQAKGFEPKLPIKAAA